MDELKAENNSYSMENVAYYNNDQLYEIPLRKGDEQLPSKLNEVNLATQTLQIYHDLRQFLKDHSLGEAFLGSLLIFDITR